MKSTIFRKPAALVLLAAWMLGGCLSRDPRYSGETVYLGGYKSRPKEHKRAPHDDVSYWDDSAGDGPASIRISLTEQKAYFFKGQDLVGVSVLSSGREGFSSPTGSFKIQLKDRDHKSSLYGDYVDKEGNVLMRDIDVKKDPKPPGAIFDGSKMPFFMKITGGVGMHEGYLPGYPASHGCIRMPGFMAEKFFDNVLVGTPVVITP